MIRSNIGTSLGFFMIESSKIMSRTSSRTV
uniref:Uncharacterized protein n=1 Tax=Arundo donax TaxID=35708 RepID=A0A0A8YQA7_ARUDO